MYIGDWYRHIQFDTNISPQVPVFSINRESVPAPNNKCGNIYFFCKLSEAKDLETACICEKQSYRLLGSAVAQR